MVPLQADAHREVLLLRFFVGRQHSPDARAVDGDRLFHEHVLARFDRRFEMDRAEAGRRGQDHDVDVGVEDTAKSVEPEKLAVGTDDDLLGPIPLQARQRAFHAVRENIRGRDEFHAPFFIRLKRVDDGARPAPAAADQADPQRIAPRHVVLAPRRGSQRRSGRGSGTPREKLPPIQRMHCACLHRQLLFT